MVKVWDRLVRVIHWSVAALVLPNLINESGSDWHVWAGYSAAALVLVRIAWGFLSPGYAGFSRWWPGLRGLLDYLRASFAGCTPRHIGINPAGAFMAATLWFLILALAVTGWMMDLDRFWGEEWLENLHEFIAYTMLACVCLHVAAVIAVSIRHRENLPKAMITGNKRTASAGRPEHPANG